MSRKPKFMTIESKEPILLTHTYTFETMTGELKILYPIKGVHNRIRKIFKMQDHVVSSSKERTVKIKPLKTEQKKVNFNSANTKVYFRFFEDVIINHIDSCKTSIYLCMYNIDNQRITNSLIDAFNRGVELRIITSYKCLYGRQNQSFVSLLEAGIDLTLIIHNMDNAYEIDNSMHTKFAIFDSQVTFTGSLNWENLSCTVNDEAMIVTRDHDVAMVYKNMFLRFAYETDVFLFCNRIFDTRTDNVLREIVRMIHRCKSGETIYIAMFIFMEITMYNHHETNIMDALYKATERHITVNIIVDGNTNSNTFGQYYHRKIPINAYLNRIEKEWKNTNVFRIKTYKGNNKYAAIHHKFITIPSLNYVAFGSSNMWDISFRSEDDMVTIEDRDIAKQFTDEWYILLNPCFVVTGVVLQNNEHLFVELSAGKRLFAMNYNKTLNEYYSIVSLTVDQIKEIKTIRYRYIILKGGMPCKVDIVRTKPLQMYRLTDVWGENNMWDSAFTKVILL